jgi:deoxyribodipyrimidine photo-lyase
MRALLSCLLLISIAILLRWPERERFRMDSFEPLTRQDALKCWKGFLPRVAAYAAARNHVSAGHENVSRLSAAIRFRTLLEDEIIEGTLARYTFQAAEKWLQEVCWRRYWKGWLEMRPQIWAQWRKRVHAQQKELPGKTLERAIAVMAGESGVACMDKIARELVETGYLHNHARMWWASFWIHVEGLPWDLGADFFFRHLLDADPASNTLSWRWVAGLQTPGKTYLVRLSNLEKYGAGYLSGDAAGNERLADSEVTARVVSDSAERAPVALPVYPTSLHPAPVRVGLWLHQDDVTPEIGPLEHLCPVTVAASISDHVSVQTYRLSPRRIASLQTVLRDGLSRAAAHYDCPAAALVNDDPVSDLCAWAGDNGLQEVIAFAPMVGPTGDMVPRLRTHLESRGIRLTLVRRASDSTAFSFATAGFFPFWQKMRDHLHAP